MAPCTRVGAGRETAMQETELMQSAGTFVVAPQRMHERLEQSTATNALWSSPEFHHVTPPASPRPPPST
eukprot:363291-Chlamydomonas_euryale.AAC.19